MYHRLSIGRKIPVSASLKQQRVCVSAARGDFPVMMIQKYQYIRGVGRGLMPRMVCMSLNCGGSRSGNECTSRRTKRRGGGHSHVVAAASSDSSIVSSSSVTRAVLFDMDGVLCNSEVVSRQAGAETMKVLYGIDISPDEFIPYTGTGEANFLGGVARAHNVAGFDVEKCKEKFFEIYLSKYAVPGAGIGYAGAKDLVLACRKAGLKTAVASSADLVKVHGNLSAADIPLDVFDAIVSADAFENLKPSPDIFLAASKQLGVPPAYCVVIEDAVAGVQAARAADMRVIGVTTTLGVDDMAASGPDEMYSSIAEIPLDNILNLKYNASENTSRMEKMNLDVERNRRLLGESNDAGTNEVVVLFMMVGLAVLSIDSVVFLATGDLALAVFKCTKYSSQVGLLLYIFLAFPYWKNSLGLMSGKSLQKYVMASSSKTGQQLETSEVRRVIANFAMDGHWINSSEALHLNKMKDQVILLKFWTSGCINCQNIMSRVDKLRKMYRGKLSVIGVHSAKFERENMYSIVESAVKLHEVSYPVYVDTDRAMFRNLGVLGWPTCIVLVPCGTAQKDGSKCEAKILGTFVGENAIEDLEIYLDSIFADIPEGENDYASVPPLLFKDAEDIMPSFVSYDRSTDRIFLSDTKNNRIVVIDSSGKCLQTIGGGGSGYSDGEFRSVKFSSPRGVVYSPRQNTLFVCDTDNHSIRAIDFDKEIVRTIAGNGNQGFDAVGGAKGMLQRLNSPYGIDIHPDQDILFVSMAGLHQIWAVSLSTCEAYSISGCGRELNRNGDSGLKVAWAQPQGVALSQDGLIIADSESSSIRKMDLSNGGSSCLAGGDPLFEGNLFCFGDRDGYGSLQMIPIIRPLLQHPHDIAIHPDLSHLVYISDTYNNKIKVYDMRKNQLKTVSDVFDAPEGLCFLTNDELIVLDRSQDNRLHFLNVKDGSIRSIPIRMNQNYNETLCQV